MIVAAGGPAVAARLASIHHDGSARYVVPARAAPGDDPALGPALGDEVTLRVRSGSDAAVERIYLRTAPDGEQHFTQLAAAPSSPGARWWAVTLRVEMPVTGYRFLIVSADGARWLNAAGLHTGTPTDHDDFRLVAGFTPPPWLAGAVFYQVFPDRFENGDPAIDVPDGAWTYQGHPARHARWGDPPSAGPGGVVEFFGGDLQGVESRLDHLVDLGVNAIYLNPVFDTRSYHGYDTIDYRRVAAHLGGDAALLSLRRATERLGIRLILDIAPNHTGVEHPWFREAQRSLAAPTASWYTFRSHPHDYESWMGRRTLPKLDYRDAALRREMYAGPDSILRSWLHQPFRIDGWRIDVANMLGRLGSVQLGAEVAREIRIAVKEARPDAYLLGEHVFDATEQLAGDQWDGVMNYAGFRAPALDWLADSSELWVGAGGVPDSGPRASTEDLVGVMTAFRAAVPWAVASCQYNLLGSHDTGRVRTRLGGDRGRLRAAFGLLLTSVGVPSILYGDEIGLGGADGRTARATMPWDRRAWDLDHLAFVRTLVQLRRSSDALREGGFQVLEVTDTSFSYLRDTEQEQAIIVVVRGPGSRPAVPLRVDHAAIPDGTELRSPLTGRALRVAGGQLRIGETGPGIEIWLTRRERESDVRPGRGTRSVRR